MPLRLFVLVDWGEISPRTRRSALVTMLSFGQEQNVHCGNSLKALAYPVHVTTSAETCHLKWFIKRVMLNDLLIAPLASQVAPAWP